MTAAAVPETSERQWAPAEGWSVLVLVIVLGLIVGTAIDEPAWVDGRGYLTDSLSEVALLGALVGFAGPKLGWGRWTTHGIGAILGGLLLPIIAGWAILPGSSPAEAFRATADGSLNAYLDLAVRGLPFTQEEVHYVLILSAIVWGTMQFGSYAVFGHRRPLAAVVVVGLVLLTNMALTRRDQLGWLVLYAAVSLFLLIQMHAFGERATWTRRRIGDPASISLVYLRGGTVFILAAMVASLVLTQRAASSPLAGAWTGLDSKVVQISQQLAWLFPAGGDLRSAGGVAFGSSAPINSQWTSDQGVAFTAKVPATAKSEYWRAATYDTYTLGGWGGGWSQSQTSPTAAPAGANLLEGSPEVPSKDLVVPITATVQPVGFHDSPLLAPGFAGSVSLPSTLELTGVQGWFASDQVATDTPYTVSALALKLAANAGLAQNDAGLTQNKLRAASTVYPKDVTDQYTQVADGVIGTYARQLLDSVLANARSHNPYDLASYLQTFLQSPSHFNYTTDVRSTNCQDRSAVECFAQYKQGYCLYYATTMAILLRAANPSDPIPTRLVQGFLPSQIIDGQETVLNEQAHAWVEVYFPGYGWIPFDPTGGGRSQPLQIPEGKPVPTAAPPTASAGTGPGTPRPSRREFEPAGGSGGLTPTGSAQPADRVLAALIGGLLALTVGSLIVAAWWRGPRGELSPENAWLWVSGAASRLGFAPRPTETVYEYATSLGELIPVARPDINTVAEAKVETTYARLELTPEREHDVALALRRLRLSLVRLLFKRVGRRGRRR
jgi:transglutaminase-like putative cysteine protease